MSLHDPCLALSKDVIFIVFVDGMLVYGRDEALINSFVVCTTNKEEAKLQCGCTVEGYIGVDIKRNGHKTTLTQSGLDNRVTEALRLHNKYSTATPVECANLPCDSVCKPAVGTFNYTPVVGMLLYLTGHSCPDCAFKVH